MIVKRIYKTLISEPEDDYFEYKICILRKAIELSQIAAVEESDIFNEEGYETIYITLKSGLEFFIIANFDIFYKKWQESKKFNIFANNN